MKKKAKVLKKYYMIGVAKGYNNFEPNDTIICICMV